MVKSGGAKAPSQRQLRVGEEIRHALSDLFLRGEIYVSDSAFISVTVPEVRVSPDLRNATAFVYPLAGKAPEGFIEDLNSVSPQISHMVSKRVKLRFASRIVFKLDSSFDTGHRIESLIESVKEPL